jgi:hypothetical protein
MFKLVKRKRGAPAGSQNARKHGFYAKVLDESEEMDFELAAGVNGIDDEIALLRVKIKSLLAKDPENIQLIMKTASALAWMVRTRYGMPKKQGKNVKDGIIKALRDFGFPVAIGIGSAMGKRG